MKVLHVTAGLAARTGGPATAVVEASLALVASGVEVTVLSTDLAGPAIAPGEGPARPADLPEGADRLDVRLFPARRPRRLAYAPALGAALRQMAPGFDVIHVHSLFLHPQLSACRAARGSGTPYVVAPCGVFDPALRHRNRTAKRLLDGLGQRRLLDGAAALQYKTAAERDLAADLGFRAPAVVLPNGVDCARFAGLPDPTAFRRRWLRGSEGRVVLNLGRLSHKKRLDVLIAAFARASAAAPDAHLVLAGPDDEGLQPGLTRIAREAGVADRVVFTGMLHGSERLEALAAADVWALPSSTENFGSAVLEALAAGVATVVSPAVNLAPEALSAGAVLVAPGDPETFGAALGALLDDRSRRAALGEAGRRFAAHYDWSRVARQLVELYERVAARRSTTPAVASRLESVV